MKIVLIGFMCSGKSKVGKILANRLGWLHQDTDEMITAQVGASIAEIIKRQGESAFREIERKAISLVALLDRAVISTGGGAPIDSSNMKNLSQNAQMIWLKVSPEVVLRRAGNIASRPLIDPKDPLGSIQKKLKERESIYSQASISVDTDHSSPTDVAEKILAALPEGVK